MQQVARVRIGEIEIEYEEHGAGERAFVLVHGFTGSRDDWLEQLPRLAGLGRTLALDQRGHGGSTNTGDLVSYSLDQLARDLAGFLDAVGIERCDLLGHSLGGMVVLRFALAHPDRVSSLVLMDTSPSGMTSLPERVFEATAAVFRSSGGGALTDLIRSTAENDPQRSPAAARSIERMGAERHWGRIRAKLEAMDPEAFAGLGSELREQAGVAPRLAEIRCPTLVIVGEEDKALLEPAALLEAGIPDAMRVTVPGAAHSPQIENAGAWFDAIAAHLARSRR